MKKTIVTLLIAFALVFTGVGLVEAQSVMEKCTLVRQIEYDGNTFSPDQAGGYGADQELGVSGGAEEGEVDIDHGNGAGSVICMINMVNRAAQVLFFIMMGLVAGFVIVGGFFILTGGGNEENIAKGKKFITYAIIGVFIGVFAYAVPAIINFIM